MGKTRIVRFDYFLVACRDVNSDPNDIDGRFDLNEWLSIVLNQSPENVTQDYYEEKAKLETYRHNNVENYWFLSFSRLRTTNIPKIGSADKAPREIDLDDDEFIAEDANAIYDERHNILMLQRNVHSLGSQGITKYINMIWDNREGKAIHLRPIKPRDAFVRAKKKGLVYRKFTVRFADCNTKGEHLFRGSKRLKQIVDAFSDFEGVNIEVSVSMGHSKEGLNNDTVAETIYDLEKNPGLASSAGIKIKDGKEPVEILDLLDDKISDSIPIFYETRRTLSSEYVENLMYEQYRAKRAIILDSL